MLPATPLVSPPVRTGPAAPAEPAAPPGATQPFAMALDQATAEQREAAGEAAADKSGEAAPADAPGGTAQTASAQRRASAARTAAAAQNKLPASEADAPLLRGTQAASSLPVLPTEEAAAVDDEAAPFDLSAWIPGLPLTPPARPQASTAETDEPVAPGLMAGVRAGAQRDAKRTDAQPESVLAGAEPHRDDEAKLLAPAPAVADPRRDAAPRAEAANAASMQPPTLPRAPRAVADAEPSTPAVTPLAPSIERARDSQPLMPGAAPAIAPAQLLAATASATPAAPFQAELNAALGTPAFAPALGSQLSVLVRDGIEHARLKLNPAEMGPIDVRISLDGQQAQVDFSAAHAVTRQLLQDAVPALASALRESGLTLTGGGVFDQSREQRGELQRGPAPQPGSAFDDGPDAAPTGLPLPRPTVARGVVDLYA